MYESKKEKFDWKGLVVKILIILAVLILFLMIFPLGSKKKDNYSNGFKDNLTKLKDVGGSYFDKDNLPSEVGDSTKVSLKDLINNKKIDTLKVGKTTCNEDDSYIKIVKKSKGYELETTLICGDEKNTSYSYLGCIDNCGEETTTTTTTTTSTKKKTTTSKVVTTSKITTTTTTTQAKYAVIFNRNMGSDVTTIYVNKGGIVGKPVDPVREGYVFAGWYLHGELYEFNTPVKSNIVLIAKWVRK